MSVLVTGAGGAIGAAVARALIARGDQVVAHDLTPNPVEPLVEAGAVGARGDLHDLGSLAGLADLCREQSVDRVVAAHGVDGSASLAGLTPEFVRRVMQVNAVTVPRLYEALREQLQRMSGVFEVVASQAGLRAEPNNAAYCASKFAVVGWVRAIAPTADERNQIAVRALCPGCTESPLLFAAQERFAEAEGIAAEEFIARRRAQIPIQRFGRVEETAAAAVYLLDRTEARPQVLAVTGGEVPW